MANEISFPADVTITGSVDQGDVTIKIVQQAAIEQPPTEPPPSGDGWRPPSWLKTDTKTYPIPNAPRPAYLDQTTDPTFGTKITRITGDPGTAISNISGARWGDASRHHYNTDQAWNADQSLIYLDMNQGQGAAGPNGLFVDGSSYEPRFSPKNHPSGDVRWSATDPDLMVYVSGNAIGTWNPKTGEQTVIETFSGYSGLTYGGYSGALSTDGKMLVATGTKNGRAVGFAFNIETGEKHADFWQEDFGGRGDWSAFISSKGSYVVVGIEVDVTITCDLNGREIHRFPSNYLSHGDTMTDANGDELIVARTNGEPVDVTGGLVSKFRLRDGRRTELTTGGYASHTSARYQRDYCVADMFPDGGPPYLSEIVMCALDGSAVYRLAHHHSETGEYISQPQPSHSRDGGRVIFASSWGASDSRPVGAYVLDFRR
jgi:hypothetical protein